MAEESLVPCPCCASEWHIYRQTDASSPYRVVCSKCDAEGPLDPSPGEPINNATRAWNAWVRGVATAKAESN